MSPLLLPLVHSPLLLPAVYLFPSISTGLTEGSLLSEGSLDAGLSSQSSSQREEQTARGIEREVHEHRVILTTSVHFFARLPNAEVVINLLLTGRSPAQLAAAHGHIVLLHWLSSVAIRSDSEGDEVALTALQRMTSPGVQSASLEVTAERGR